MHAVAPPFTKTFDRAGKSMNPEYKDLRQADPSDDSFSLAFLQRKDSARALAHIRLCAPSHTGRTELATMAFDFMR